MAYVHPILGLLSVLLMCWVALNGLRSRHKARYALKARRLHHRVAPWIYLLWAITLAVGWASTTWIRSDIHAGSTKHFVAAWASLVVFGIAALLSLRVPQAPWARRIHPWFGIAGVVIALTLAALGMTLLP